MAALRAELFRLAGADFLIREHVASRCVVLAEFQRVDIFYRAAGTPLCYVFLSRLKIKEIRADVFNRSLLFVQITIPSIGDETFTLKELDCATSRSQFSS